MIALRRTSAAAAVLAVFAMGTTPLAAADFTLGSAHAAAVYDSEAGNAEGWGNRRYRGWGRHSGRHIRTGDAIAGIALLGAVVAIASVADNASERNRERDEPVRYRENYREPVRSSSSDWNRGGITGAVDMCVGQVERGDDRVGSVDEATRDGSGWRVIGTLANGEGFACRIDNEGRIRSVDLGGSYSDAGGQWSDEDYRSARAASRTPIDQPAGDEVQPAYPGGPLPGEEVDADLGG